MILVRTTLIALAATLAVACGDAERAPQQSLPGDGFAAGQAGARPDEVAVPDDAPLVVFLGDSISAGLHLAAEQAFPAVLQRELAADGHPFRLVNAGVSGDTSAGGLRRIDWVLGQKPDVLVLELGGNDGLRGMEPAQVEANLREIVARARAAGARVLLLGVQLPTSYGAEYARDFAAIYPRIAADLGVACVPSFLDGVGGVPELTLPDGLHPTAEGHRRIARTVGPALAGVLETLRTARSR